jgi:hypothetical protein
MGLHAAEWRGYAPSADDETVQIVAMMTSFEPRRVDVEDDEDSVTVTIHEYVPDEHGIHEPIGVSTRFDVPLPTPLAGRPVIDGATGERREMKPRWRGAGTRVPVGENFRWHEVAGKRWPGRTA